MEVKEIFAMRLKQARLRLGLSMEALSQRIGGEVTKQTISKYEAGKVMASSLIIGKLSEALNVSMDYFLKPFTFDITKVEVSFRKQANVGAKELSSLKFKIQEKVERFLEIEKILGIENKPLNFLLPLKITDQAQMKSLAKQVRDKWNIGDSPIISAKGLLMNHGIKVFEIEGPSGFDGVSGTVNDSTYIVVINKNKTHVERKRLTLLHELAHLIVDNNLDESLTKTEKENLCNVFASELLLPSKILDSNFSFKSKIAFQEIEKVQKTYGISIDAIMYSLKRSGIISDKRFRSFCIRKNKDCDFKQKIETSRYKEPEDVNDISKQFETLVYSAIAQELISPSKASELLNCSILEVESQLIEF